MKMHRICFILVLAPLIGCKSEEPYHERVLARQQVSAFRLGDTPYQASFASSTRDEKVLSPQQRMVIKSADIGAEVIEYDTAAILLQKIVASRKGFIVSSNTNISELGKKNGIIVIRIPSLLFDETLEAIAGVSSKTTSKYITGNDVTEEYYDISARLENKKRIENRYRDILKNAKNVEEILSVEKYLGEVREDIEKIEGRRRYLTDQVTLSTITVRFHEPEALAEHDGIGFWQKLGNGFKRGLGGFGDMLAYSITFIIASIPIILLLSLLTFAAIKLIRVYRIRKNKS